MVVLPSRIIFKLIHYFIILNGDLLFAKRAGILPLSDPWFNAFRMENMFNMARQLTNNRISFEVFLADSTFKLNLLYFCSLVPFIAFCVI
jgi:hypothetical protein